MPVKIVYDNSGISWGRTPHSFFRNGSEIAPKSTDSGSRGKTAEDLFKNKLQESMTTYKLKKDEGKRAEYVADLPFNLTAKSMSKTNLVKMAQEKKFENLKSTLVGKGKLYEDPDFKPEMKSIGEIPGFKYSVEWKRAKDINPSAEFVKGGISRFDIKQGVLGDCWLLAVIATISEHKKMIEWCCPPEQFLQGPKYTGMFMFRFWRFGKWEEIIIDDYLPVMKGTNNLLFLHSSDKSEMWSALMEKAYAKLNGSYANLVGGLQAEAMEDLTGGICETINLDKPTPELENVIRDHFDRCCLMGCSVDSKTGESKLSNGIIAGHAYSITGMTKVNHKGRQQTLIRCRNPWGNSDEWNGAWADNAKEWEEISADEKKRINLEYSNDGEFWMSFETFVDVFDRIEICSLGMESLEKGTKIRNATRLEENVFVGEWIANVNAGGCANNKATYAKNPQFIIQVPKLPDSDSNLVTIGLMQKDMRQINNGKFLVIGFTVYKIPDGRKEFMPTEFFSKTRYITLSEFASKREVVVRVKLQPGTYLIMPSTFAPNETAKFIIRVFTPIELKDDELDQEDAMVGVPKELIEKIHSGSHGHDHDKEVLDNFNKLKSKEGILYPGGLMKLLNESGIRTVAKFNGFNKEMCRSMIAAMDAEMKGGLNWAQTEELWECCESWKYIFEMYDPKKTGVFNAFQLREALLDSGFKVCNRVFAVLVARFTDHEKGDISFEDYILGMVRLKNTFENLEATPDGQGEEEKIFKVDEYLQQSLYI